MPKRKDITGLRSGRLVALEFDTFARFPSGVRYEKWRCKCDCGSYVSVNKKNLMAGLSRSCGCVNAEANARRLTTHGDRKSRLYNTWCNIKSRCYNPENQDFDRYGGRGISMFEPWRDNYLEFKDWAIENGYNDSLTIDRINVDGNYCPDNCRWVDMVVQANNRSNTIYIEYNGEIHTCAEWSKITGINYDTLNDRYHRGLTGDSLFKNGRHKTGPKSQK